MKRYTGRSRQIELDGTLQKVVEVMACDVDQDNKRTGLRFYEETLEGREILHHEYSADAYTYTFRPSGTLISRPIRLNPPSST